MKTKFELTEYKHRKTKKAYKWSVGRKGSGFGCSFDNRKEAEEFLAVALDSDKKGLMSVNGKHSLNYSLLV